MKKFKIVAVAMVAVMLFGGVAFKIGANAQEPVVENDNYSETKEVSVEQFDELLPVISALGGHIYTRNSGYHPTKSTFYSTSFNNILKYTEANKLADYTEDENNYYIDEKNILILSDIAYYAGDIYELQGWFNKDLNKYVISKTECDMGFSVKLTKATESYTSTDSTYNLKGELYKDGVKVDDVKVYVNHIENNSTDFAYSIRWMSLDNHGFDVY